MYKKLKISLLVLCTLLGVVVTSCQDNSKDVAPITESQTPKSVDDLIRAMANDDLVREDILKDASYLSKHMLWFRSLTRKEQKANLKSVSQNVSDPAHTAEQQKAYFTGAQARRAEIATRYPELGKLDEKGLSRVWSEVVGTIVTDPETLNSMVDGNCYGRYRQCGSTDACYRDYILCEYWIDITQ
ncbi:hypothetical protein [Hymenobacter sp. UYP22]|uniref:hypothetical protein n=1 Tax=Hymenobacter sp. UYP22 TaxID=3156348 RepID=UPI00339B4081